MVTSPAVGVYVAPAALTLVMAQPAWSVTMIWWLPCSAASTWASWKASTPGLYSDHLTLLAPLVSIQVAASPSTGSLRPGFQNRVSISTMRFEATLKLSVLLEPGTKQCLLPRAEQSSRLVGETHTLYTPPLL